MSTRATLLLRFVTGLFFLVRISYADDAVNTNDIRFTFIEPPIVPMKDLPREARRAGISPAPEGKKDKATEIQFGVVRDPKDHGALSKIVAGHIATIAVTWADANRFTTRQQTEAAVRRLLSAPAGSDHTGSYCKTYTYVVWSQALGQPDIVASVEHRDGKPGQLLLFASGDHYLFAYKDREAKWWLGQWREGSQK